MKRALKKAVDHYRYRKITAFIKDLLKNMVNYQKYLKNRIFGKILDN